MRDERYEVDFLISQMVGNEANRNIIAREFLKTDFDFLLMMDCDNPPHKNPLDLVELDKDVVSLPTPINMNQFEINDFRWNIFDKYEDPNFPVCARKFMGTGLEEVYAVGTGCILIARRVLEKMSNPFTPVRDDTDKRKLSQDVVFSIRCHSEGFSLWTHWDYKCLHYKEIDLLTLIDQI